jgi:peptidyl-prolyl cis-trans isomerase C
MMVSRRSQALVGLVVLAISGVVVLASAQNDRTVATIGDRKITLGEAQARLDTVPLMQLKNLGSDPATVKARFVEQLATLELLVQGARDKKLHERRDVRDRIRDKLRMALLNDLHREALEAGEVSDEEVAKYYDENRSRYAAQQRLKIWQIVLGTRAEAQDVLNIIANDEEYAKDPIAGWDKLARERSLDKATSMRKGNLGFVQPDGVTAHKDIKVPAILFQAASKIADGELLKTPLKVDKYWVVLQRRGSVVTPERKLDTEATAIRGVLAKQKVAERQKELLDELRARYVKEKNPSAVDAIEIDHAGDIGHGARPGTLKRRSHRTDGKGKPQGSPGKLR